MQTRNILTVCALTLATSLSLCQTRSTSGHASTSGTVLSPAETNAFLAKAQQAYYSLPTQGLRDFACDVVPSWEMVATSLTAGSGGEDQVLPAVNNVRYRVDLHSNGSPNVSREGAVAATNKQGAGVGEKVVDGAEQALHGFLRSWWTFSSGQVFAGGSGKNRVENLGDNFRLTQGAGARSAQVVLSRELVIQSVHANVNYTVLNISPTFTHVDDGLLLAGYRGDITDAHGTQQVFAKVSYQDVDGFLLPLRLNISSELPDGKSVILPMRFTNCGTNGRYTNPTAPQPSTSRVTMAQASPPEKSLASAAPSQPAATPSQPPAAAPPQRASAAPLQPVASAPSQPPTAAPAQRASAAQPKPVAAPPSQPPAATPPQRASAAPLQPAASTPSQPASAIPPQRASTPSQPPASVSSQPPLAPGPAQAAVFVLKSGERVESRHYLFSRDSLQLEQEDGTPRTIPLSAINLDATVTANRERGIDMRIPHSKGEITVSF